MISDCCPWILTSSFVLLSSSSWSPMNARYIFSHKSLWHFLITSYHTFSNLLFLANLVIYCLIFLVIFNLTNGWTCQWCKVDCFWMRRGKVYKKVHKYLLYWHCSIHLFCIHLYLCICSGYFMGPDKKLPDRVYVNKTLFLCKCIHD